MISRADVVSAYRFILGREPENDTVINEALLGYESVGQIRDSFIHSPEFSRTVSELMSKRVPLDLAEQLPIEVTCDQAVLKRLLARVESTWTRLGQDDPYWSVLTYDSYRIGQFQQNRDSFWSTGERDVLRLNVLLERNGIVPDRNWRCLEYGCGTGRVTRWLAKEFNSIVACDISGPHLALTQKTIEQSGFKGAVFVRIASLTTLDELPNYDLLYSLIVLQHNPPPVIAHILGKLLNKLNPGGIGYFQVPTFYRGYTFNVQQYLASTTGEQMEMHILPQRYIFDIIQSNGCSVLEVHPDVISPEFISNTFLVRNSRERGPNGC